MLWSICQRLLLHNNADTAPWEPFEYQNIKQALLQVGVGVWGVPDACGP